VALTAFQRTVFRLLAASREASGESYVAGGVALNELIAAARVSRDIDVFHDTDAALAASWEADRKTLERNGYDIAVVRAQPFYVEAEIVAGAERLRLEWDRDSAFRFFPLLRHAELGLTLHPFDLATNKVLALVGRLEVRDWVGVIASDACIQPLGYLAWAACAKDPGFSPPPAILEAARRPAGYSAGEVAQLAFEGPAPDAAELGRAWHRALDAADEVIARLPVDEAGTCVLSPAGELFRGSPDALASALRQGELRYHRGRIRGELPRIIG
jgi:hypothetical protein